MKGIANTAAGEPDPQAATAAIRTLDRADVDRWLTAVADWGMAQPSAQPRYGIVGFCWGGGTSFAHAVAAPELDASVVYYGPSPDPAAVGAIRAPVLGLYAGEDARINNGLPAVDAAMKAAGKPFEQHIFEGSGHGFLRQQDGRDGANMAASQRAWPLTVQFFKRHLEG
jgi:carboxymethylenebutenolidase